MITAADADWLSSEASVESKWAVRRHGKPTAGALTGRTVVVGGGGTAGYLTALAFQRHTGARVRLIESKAIGHIGVGEATVPGIVPFLHSFLSIDVARFYSEVQPTWKLGIKFEWGRPSPYYFLAPFDWGADSIGTLGSLREHGNLNAMSLLALLMDVDRVPLFRGENGTLISLMKQLPVAYHFDVGRLIAFLAREAAERGVEHLDLVVGDVRLSADGRVEAVMTEAGPIEGDFFVDCSGFRALLLGQALRTPFVSFDASLFTDAALAFERPHGGHVKPYTTATTMECGWTWTIPQADEDHCGYVFSTAFCTPEAADVELTRRFGRPARPPRLVRFKSGRRQKSWVGNVAAIGNASGFVEPLESTGLLMTTDSIRLLIDGVGAADDWARAADRYNTEIAASWDGLRWFLSIHYRFNAALDTPFWRAAREETDYSGIADVVSEFQSRAPLRSRDPAATRSFERRTRVLFYGLSGIDCILLGQQVPARVASGFEDHAAWLQRRDRVRRSIASALTMREVLELPDLARHLRASGNVDVESRTRAVDASVAVAHLV